MPSVPLPTSRPAPADLRRARVAVSLYFATMGATMGSWAARIPGVRGQLALDDAQWGLAIVNQTVGSLVAVVVMVVMASRVGPRRLAALAAAVLLLDAPLLASSRHVPQLVAGLLVLGLSASVLNQSMNAQAVELERRVGRAIMSSFHACFSLGQLAGGGIGTVAARLAVPPGLQLAGSGVVLAALLLATARHRPADDMAVTRARRRPLRERVTPQLLLLAAIALCSSINEGAASQWSAEYTSHTLGGGAGLGGATFTAYALAMTVGRLGGDAVRRRLGPTRFLRTSESLLIVGFGAALAVGTPWAAILGFVCVGLGSSSVIPTTFGLGGNQPGHTAAEGVSVVALGSWPAFLLGPPIIGALAGVWGLRVGLCLLLVSGAAIVLLAGRLRVP